MNLTITVDDDLLKKARMRALEDNTSVNAILREYLESYVDASTRKKQAVTNLLEMSRNTVARRGATKWTREELHER